jgi:cell fate (sporulation/competence/biofilm development) regulator YlbF (YheA/YmcA/DUF963 family)
LFNKEILLMDVIEKAKELGVAITQDPRCVRLQVAKAANEADMELQKMIGEFNLKKIMLNAEYKKTPPDDARLKAFEEELRGIYGRILENDRMAEFNAAKKGMDEMLSHINGIIQVAISGEIDTPAGCSGSCEGCAGCH